MPNRPLTARRPSRNGNRSAPDEEQVEQIQGLHADQNIDALRDKAIDLLHRNHQRETRLKEFAIVLDQLKEKCATITAHPHFEVVIIGVELNGQRTVEVAGFDNTRVHVEVDTAVESSDLQVGACGLVTRERNCLLKVLPKTGPWSEVGTFDQYLGDGEALLTDRENRIRVTLVDPLKQQQLTKGDLIGYDAHVAHLAYTRIESAASDHLFDESVEDDFSELGGLDDVIAQLKRYVDFRFQNPAIASRYMLRDKHGVLFHGPPGNGKTKIARCLASYAGSKYFMHISGSQDYSMWFGSTEQKIIERFDAIREAAEHGLVVVFFDEIDAIGRRRGSDQSSSAPARILNTLLSQLDGIKKLSNVLIIAATNRADTLDEGLIRPGRIDHKIEIPSPNRTTATAVLKHYLARGLPLQSGGLSIDQMVDALLAPLFTPNGDYREVAHVKTNDGRRLAILGKELLSGAMLESVVSGAADQAAVREADTGAEGITLDDLVVVLGTQLRETVMLLSPANVKNYATSIPQDAIPIAVEVAPRLLRLDTFIRNGR